MGSVLLRHPQHKVSPFLPPRPPPSKKDIEPIMYLDIQRSNFAVVLEVRLEQAMEGRGGEGRGGGGGGEGRGGTLLTRATVFGVQCVCYASC